MVAAGVDELLDKVLTTKMQRKAKSVIMTCLEFCLTNAFILLNIAEQAKLENKATSLSLKIVVGISVGYAAVVAGFVFIHGLMLGDTTFTTNKEVEDAYAKTNAKPFVDGILEIPLAVKFKGPKWWLIWINWGVFFALTIAYAIIVGTYTDFDLQTSTSVATAAAVFILYQITGDFAEYWIYTRNSKPKNDDPDV